MKLSPPKGAEFGKTEVFYLQVQSSDRQRAIDLAAALSDQLKKRFEDLRDARALSVIEELSRTVTLSESDLNAATEKLALMDAAAGPDLGELHTMLDTPAGDSPLRRSIIEMQTELRRPDIAGRKSRIVGLARVVEGRSRTLLAAPSRLLESQPVLKRLKDGLVDAQIHSAQLMSTMSASHPSVQAAKDAEAEIANHLNAELDAAILGVEGEVHLSRREPRPSKHNYPESGNGWIGWRQFGPIMPILRPKSAAEAIRCVRSKTNWPRLGRARQLPTRLAY